MTGDIGTTIKVWRKRRGMTQATLAGLAGVSQPYISQVEQGVQSIDRRSKLVAIASALQVTVSELLGQPGDPTDPSKALAALSVPLIRIALVEISAGYRNNSDPLSRDDLARLFATCDAHRLRCDFAAAAPMLPKMLADGAFYGPHTASEAAHSTASLLRSIGYRDLAWRAADTALDYARQAEDDKLIAAAQFMRLMTMPPEAHQVIYADAVRTYEDMQSHTQPGSKRGYGALHLPAALASSQAGNWDTAQDHLTEAQHIAGHVGEPDIPGGLSMSFGPTNVGLWKMASLLEAGHYREVVDVARTLHPQNLPHANRQSSFWLDLGRAQSHIPGQDRQAIMSLARAERLAPQYMRALPAARNAVSALIGRAKQRAVANDLRQLADRLGLSA